MYIPSQAIQDFQVMRPQKNCDHTPTLASLYTGYPISEESSTGTVVFPRLDRQAIEDFQKSPTSKSPRLHGCEGLVYI